LNFALHQSAQREPFCADTLLDEIVFNLDIIYGNGLFRPVPKSNVRKESDKGKIEMLNEE